MKLPDEFKILNTPIVRKHPYNSALMWGILDAKNERFELFNDEYKEREKALFEYFGLEPRDIEQPQIRELVHKLAVANGFKGFNFKPIRENNDDEWGGRKGKIFFFRIHLERIKLKQTNKKHGNTDSIIEFMKHEYPEYLYDLDTLKTRYNEVVKENPEIKAFEKWVDSENYTIENTERLLEILT